MAEVDEKPATPQIILTPSTPTLENPHIFFADHPLQRPSIILLSPSEFDGLDVDSDLKSGRRKSWRRCGGALPPSTLRLLLLLAIVGAVVLVHVLILS